MEQIVILIILLLAAPFVLSIVALVMASNLKQKVAQLQYLLDLKEKKQAATSFSEPVKESQQPVAETGEKEEGLAVTPSVPGEPVTEESVPPAGPPEPAAGEGAPPVGPAEPIKPPSRPISPPPPPIPAVPGGQKLEVTLGGKVASFIGIAALVIGVVFFVGYAIQHGWIGPGTRIVLGLVSGGLLVFIGHLAEVKGRDLTILARCLTGGGSALFYFCVFAAYSIYGLIGPVGAGIGLLLSAVAVLALSTVYASQVVAIIGVLGAFIAPLLIGGAFNRGLFPLVFMAVVNVPVIVLGLKRNWQVLYNTAFVFTVIYAVAWLERELPGLDSRAWLTGLFFCLLYFAEFMALGLLKLRGERNATGRAVDLLRLVLTTLALLGATYWILKEADLDDWIGAAFLIGALVHVGLARLAWKWLPAYKNELLVLLMGALTFATLALPVQLDGVWVSLGWSIEGVVLAWFALRVGSVPLQAVAVGLGLFGLMKSLVFDFTLYESDPSLFRNGRFFVGLLSSALLGVQGWLHSRVEQKETAPKEASWSQIIGCGAVVAVLAVVFADAVIALSADDPYTWLLTTIAVLSAGIALSLAAGPTTPMGLLGVFLLLAVPIKILFIDLLLGWRYYSREYDEFFNMIFWSQLIIIGVAAFGMARHLQRHGEDHRNLFKFHVPLNVAALVAGIIVVTLEIARSDSPWADSIVTLWWAICALVLALAGFMRNRRYLRYMALVVFGVTIVKVFLLDLAELSGLQRVAAFMGVGLLLLVLSFAYQQIAPKWLGEEEGEDSSHD